MNIKYLVELNHARPNWSDERITEAFNVSVVTIARIRRAFVQRSLATALQRKKPEREYEHVLDGEGESHLLALACSEPPTVKKHWSTGYGLTPSTAQALDKSR